MRILIINTEFIKRKRIGRDEREGWERGKEI
jgi:hypothetical protein